MFRLLGRCLRYWVRDKMKKKVFFKFFSGCGFLVPFSDNFFVGNEVIDSFFSHSLLGWISLSLFICLSFIVYLPLLVRNYLRYSGSVWTDWAIFCTLGKFLKPLATTNLPKSPTFLGNFCKGVKIYHFYSEIIFGQLL